MSTEENSDSLSSKVYDWLLKEGYPLEYFTASTFSECGFLTEQGAYIDDGVGGAREIDVLASKSLHSEQGNSVLVRAYTVAECKWTKKKPWVCFTSGRGMIPSAIIAQTISSELGETAFWANAGHQALHKLPLFAAPEKPAYGGRQALGDSQDRFYASIRSVVTASMRLATKYNKYENPNGFPRCAVAIFPLIVIDGNLFEASYHSDEDNIALREVQSSRLQWRGEANSPIRPNVDIVTKSGLADFVSQRSRDFDALLEVLKTTSLEVLEAYNSCDPSCISVSPAATGLLGRPALIRRVVARAQENSLD